MVTSRSEAARTTAARRMPGHWLAACLRLMPALSRFRSAAERSGMSRPEWL
uniref:Uncharacterized protein n=1 Tax=uncultured marine virus TaxID=186617 RepID=A0A0F7L899_9VIRU|nr:hypothetical protein [uncultured marine virus]